MMDLESAIQHCQEKVQEQAKKGCYSCVEEHQQLAEWLKELKAYREQGGDVSRSEIPNTCGDAIDRQAAIRAIEALQRPIMRSESNYYQFKFSGMSEALDVVENLPSVSPQQKVGRWEWVQYDGNINIGNWHCSECDRIVIGAIEHFIPANSYRYCPYCGAKMEV